MARKVAPPENPSGLFYAREHRGMSQDQLAAASGALKPMISKLENGSRELTRAWAEKFAGALRLSAIRIVFWDKVGSPPDHAEAEYDIPNRPDRPAAQQSIPQPAKHGGAPPPRLKPLRSSLKKMYVGSWREFMGVRQQAAADALGMDLGTYGAAETYPAGLTNEQMARLADAFGVRPDQFWFPPPASTPSKMNTPVSTKKARK